MVSIVMTDAPRRRTRNIEEKRARIIAAAQLLFTRKGYSQASIKDIAREAEVADGLINKHFESKLKLFEVALIAALTAAPIDASNKAAFGTSLARATLGEGGAVIYSAMIILSIEDEEARRVAMNVLSSYAVSPTEEWLGGGQHARERAIYISVMGLSLTLMERLFGDELKRGIDSEPVQWIVDAIQQTVEDRLPQSPQGS